MKHAFFFSCFFILTSAHAVEMVMRPGSGTANDIYFTDVTSSYPTKPAAFTIRANVSCYATNLRSAINPVSPTGILRMGFDLATGTTITLFFPAWLTMGDKYETLDINNKIVTKTAYDSTLYNSGDPNQSIMAQINGENIPEFGSAVKNLITFEVPSRVQTLVPEPDGSFDVTKRGNLINRIHFAQDLNSLSGSAPSGFTKNKIPDWGVQKLFARIMRPFPFVSTSQAFGQYGGDGGGVFPDNGGDGGDGNGSIITSWDLVFADQYTKLNTNQDLGWFNDTWRFQNWKNTGFALDDPNSPYRYMGRDGAVTANSEYTWSSDFKTLNVNVSFPGQFGFCGGFFSPLMFFFDEQRPKFSAEASFRMSSFSGRTYWPEKNSPGYFLVMDKNEDGIINDVSEMFGSEDEGNGFDVLAQFDLNGDGVIDEKDPIYTQLRLWKDSTGTGKTLAKDLISLRQAGVSSIQLKYRSGSAQKIGSRAELRETSTFQFIKHGKRVNGSVVDVWFASPH